MRTITVEKIDGEYKVNTKASAGAKENTITFYSWQARFDEEDSYIEDFSRGNDDPIHNQGFVFFDFDTAPQTLEELLQSHILFQGAVYTFANYYLMTAYNGASNIYNYEIISEDKIRMDAYWVAPRYPWPLQFVRHPEIENIEYKVSDGKASSTVTVYGYKPGNGKTNESSVKGHSEYYLFINEDGTIATKEDFSNVKMIINGGKVGGGQVLYYKGSIPDLYASEKIEFTDISTEGDDEDSYNITIHVKDGIDAEINEVYYPAANVSMIQLMLQGYYGG